MKTLLLFLLVIISMMPYAAASYLSIQPSITPTDKGLIIKVTNFGDESAHNVQLSVDLNNKREASKIRERLGVRESFEWDAPLYGNFKNPGSYPLVLTTSYQDANSYPFSAISVSMFSYKQPTISDIAAKASSIELSDKGTLELRIKNMAETAKDISIRLIVPKELTAEKDKLSISLPAKSEKALNFGIEKFSALDGSSYAVFAVIEYDEDDKHHTSIAQGVIQIKQKEKINFSNKSLIITLIFLIALFVLLQINNWRKSRS